MEFGSEAEASSLVTFQVLRFRYVNKEAALEREGPRGWELGAWLSPSILGLDG